MGHRAPAEARQLPTSRGKVSARQDGHLLLVVGCQLTSALSKLLAVARADTAGDAQVRACSAPRRRRLAVAAPQAAANRGSARRRGRSGAASRAASHTSAAAARVGGRDAAAPSQGETPSQRPWPPLAALQPARVCRARPAGRARAPLTAQRTQLRCQR